MLYQGVHHLCRLLHKLHLQHLPNQNNAQSPVALHVHHQAARSTRINLYLRPVFLNTKSLALIR